MGQWLSPARVGLALVIMPMTSSPLSTDQANLDSTRLYRKVLGARRLSNIWWAAVTTIGGVGFFLAGISSYLGKNLLPISDPTQLIFIPQGIAMGFYGIVGSLIAAYLWTIVGLDVGGGFNEFDKQTRKLRILRKGFWGKNRTILIEEPLSAVQSVKVTLKEGLNPERALYLKVKGRRDIPLTRVGQPMALSDIENQGAELARFLSVPLEGL